MAEPPVPLELLQGIYTLLGDLRRDSAMMRDVYGKMLTALRDTHAELEHIRGERQRIDRMERTLDATIEDGRKTNERLDQVIENVRHHTGKHPRLNADGTIVGAEPERRDIERPNPDEDPES